MRFGAAARRHGDLKVAPLRRSMESLPEREDVALVRFGAAFQRLLVDALDGAGAAPMQHLNGRFDELEELAPGAPQALLKSLRAPLLRALLQLRRREEEGR